jgi:hypothetical protein
VISAIVLVLHLALADSFSQLELRITQSKIQLLPQGASIVLITSLVFLPALNFRTAIMQSLSEEQNDFAEYRLLKKYTGQYDVIIQILARA